MELVIKHHGEVVENGRVEIILNEPVMIINIIRGDDELIATAMIDAGVKRGRKGSTGM